MSDPGQASAGLLAVLAEVFGPGRDGRHFDHRSIASEVRQRPDLAAALEFLGVRRQTAGWRAGTLSKESETRVKQWLSTIEGRELDGRRLERDLRGRYRVALLRPPETPAGGGREPPALDDPEAGAALLAALAKVFGSGPRADRFDERAVARAARDRPELLPALDFLGVRLLATGWRAGSLPKDSENRLRQWLAAIEGRDLDGRRLEREPGGRYRVAIVRPPRPPSTEAAPAVPLILDDDAANAGLLAALADVFWPGRPGGEHFDHRRISVEVRTHPQLLAAMKFLPVDKLTTGWRAGSLSEDSVDRLRQWLAAVADRDIGRWRLDRDGPGRYRVTPLGQDELPPFC